MVLNNTSSKIISNHFWRHLKFDVNPYQVMLNAGGIKKLKPNLRIQNLLEFATLIGDQINNQNFPSWNISVYNLYVTRVYFQLLFCLGLYSRVFSLRNNNYANCGARTKETLLLSVRALLPISAIGERSAACRIMKVNESLANFSLSIRGCYYAQQTKIWWSLLTSPTTHWYQQQKRSAEENSHVCEPGFVLN